MDFFLEIHNGECGLGGHFCDHQRDHGPNVLRTMTSRGSRKFKRGRLEEDGDDDNDDDDDEE